MPAFLPPGLGWLPDLPDPRDYRPDHEEIGKLLGRLKRRARAVKQVDWREYCPSAGWGAPPGSSGASGSATACVSLVQYFQRRATGRIIEPSAIFVHHVARRLLATTGNGAPGTPGHDQLRAACKAIARFGVTRAQDCPVVPASCLPGEAGTAPPRNAEPDAFAYAAAMKFPGLRYVRLDEGRRAAGAVLESVKSFLAAGFALVFGFSVCTSLSAEADIPFPTIYDGIRGGRAAMAVGYDDQRRVRSWRGALLVNPFWGDTWGENGYAWLPYTYLTAGLALDFWTFLRPEWLASGEFERPS